MNNGDDVLIERQYISPFQIVKNGAQKLVDNTRFDVFPVRFRTFFLYLHHLRASDSKGRCSKNDFFPPFCIHRYEFSITVTPSLLICHDFLIKGRHLNIIGQD